MTPDEGVEPNSDDLSSAADPGATSAGDTVATMDAPEATASAEPEDGVVARTRTSRRWRRALTTILLVLSCLTVLVSSVSIWAHRTVFNTDQWVATVGPLAQNPDVVKSVADHVTTQLDNTIKPEQTAKNLLPNALDRFAAPIGQGFEQIVHSAVTRIIQTDQFQKFWIAANTQVHARVIAVLEGKPTPHLTTTNGDVTLNLLPAYSKILKAVDSKASGLLNAKEPIPTITADTPVDQARSELSAALGRNLPANFGTPVLFHSDELASAQHLVHVFNTLIIALVIVTVALIIGTIVVAERRRRTIIALGIGVVVAMTLAVVLTKVITNQVVSSITTPDDRGAVKATITSVLKGLNVISAILIAAGLVFAILAFLTGPSRFAGSVRHHGAEIGRTLSGRNREGTVPPYLAWMARYRLPLALGGLAVALLVLIFAVQGWVGALVTILVLAAFEGLVTWVSRSSGHGPGTGAGNEVTTAITS
jgi:hypothetical protein